MKATLKQIAAHTGLSISTISRVVTGKGYVSAESRTAIEKAIQELEYIKPEHKAVSLKDHDNLVMIIVGGIRSSLSSAMLEMLVREVEKKNKLPFIAVTNFSPERERGYLQFAADNNFFGVIALTIHETPETLAMLRNFPCPVVMIDRFLPSLDLDYLRPDYYKMGFVGAEYLIRHGHRKIVFIGGSKDSPITEDKRIGFEDCMHSHGLEIYPEWIVYAGRLIYENGSAIADQIMRMEHRPTAIVSSNDLSVSIVNELNLRGVRVPEEMSIFTCEDSSMAAHCQVPITAMSVDMERMSVDAVRLLFRRHRQPNEPHNFMSYNPTLIERSSVKPPQV
ncbi:MAG: LacI family DNA-binding transcriptional regulator [Clostridia bacterium]|nr:LacI family DNA-binding transcriptional regulator [Clostridia bacterium]